MAGCADLTFWRNDSTVCRNAYSCDLPSAPSMPSPSAPRTRCSGTGPGFGVRVHATGRKVYVVQSRGPMGLRRVTLGRHGDIFTEERRKQVAVVIDRIKRGEDPIPAPPEPELSVADLAERFMRLHVKVNCKPSTAAIYRGHLDGHILPALGEMAISAVGRGEIAALHHGSATHRPLPMRSSGPYRSCTHRGRDPAPASC